MLRSTNDIMDDIVTQEAVLSAMVEAGEEVHGDVKLNNLWEEYYLSKYYEKIGY